MIKYVKGNLFATDCDIIAHGVNCRGAFGSGVAKTVAETYPKARHWYLDKYDDDGWVLGEIQPILQNDGKYIVNCSTQDNYLPRNVLNVDYNAIRICMEKLKAFAKEKGLSIAIPKIGAGLAGGDWNIIENILKEVFIDYDITVYFL